MVQAFKDATIALYEASSDSGKAACHHFTPTYGRSLIFPTKDYVQSQGQSPDNVNSCQSAAYFIGDLELAEPDNLTILVSNPTVIGNFGTVQSSLYMFGGAVRPDTVYLIRDHGSWLIDDDTVLDPDGAKTDAENWPKTAADIASTPG